MPNKKLGEILVEAGVITNRQLMEALKDQKIFGGRLGSILLEKCVISESVYLATLSKILNIPSVDLEGKKIYESVITMLSMETAWNHMMLPVELKKEEGRLGLVVAMADPLDQNAIAEASSTSGYKIIPALSIESMIRHALMDYYQNQYGRGDYTLPMRVVPKCEDGGRQTMEVSDSKVSHGSDLTFVQEREDVFMRKLDNETAQRDTKDEFRKALMEDMVLEKISRIQTELDALIRLLGRKGTINPKEYMEAMREVKAHGIVKS